MAGRGIRRLYDIEVDEISLVDRPANQHGAVVIAKRAAEDPRMAMYDEEGYELDEDLLEPGDTAYNEDGDQFVMIDDETAEELGIVVDDGSYADDEDLVGVGKFSLGDISATATNAGKKVDGMARKRKGAVLGAGVAGGAAAAFGAGRGSKQSASKSLGSDVFSELSKALRGNDAKEAVSKLAELVEESRADAAEAWAIAKALADERDLDEYTELAATYPVAADPADLGLVLSRVAKNQAGPDDIAYLDRVLSATPVNYDELGYSGYAENSVMDQVDSLASQAIGKRNDVTHEEAIVALFDANSDAYDEYLAEQKG